MSIAELKIRGSHKPAVTFHEDFPSDLTICIIRFRPVYRWHGGLCAVRKIATSARSPLSVEEIESFGVDEFTEVLLRDSDRHLKKCVASKHSGYRVEGVVGPNGYWWSPDGKPRPQWADVVEGVA